MQRLTHIVVVLVALASVVVAGPTVRKDEVINVVTVQEAEGTTAKPVTVESPASTVPKVDSAVPVKLPVAADEQTEQPTSAKTPEEEQSSSTNPPEASTTTTTTTVVATSSVAPSASGVSTIQAAPTTKPPRKTITFDQRQEGKYNIRADLENFVIVVVPSGSSSGASLLDFLTRSAQKKDAYHHHHHHHQTRKHSSANGKRKNTKAQYAGAPKKKVPQGLVTPEVIVLDESNQRSGQLAVEEFIEGRTPYKVDLSSSARTADDEEVSEPQQQQQQQQQQFGASFRFSVEPSPAVEARSSGRVRFPQVASGNYARSSSDATGRALPPRTADGSGFANTNTLGDAAGSSATNNNYHLLNLPGDGTQHQQLPTLADPSLLRPSRRSANGALEDDRSPTPGEATDAHATGAEGSNAGLANHSHLPSSFDSLEYAPLRSDVDMTQLQLQPDSADGDHYEDLAEQRQRPDGDLGGWDELRLLGAQEQCGPDRKRDSYGVCQFVRP